MSFDGNNLPFAPYASGPNYTSYAADVSQFAGRNGELRFTKVGIGPIPASPLYLDSINFSAVPEPRMFGFVIFTLVGLIGWVSSRRRSG